VGEEVEGYWLEAGLSNAEAAEMRLELDQHLTDAEAEGRSVDQVVGNTAAFAEDWAEARRGRAVASWEDVQSGQTRKQRMSRRDLISYGIGTAAVVAAAAVAGQGGNDVDNEVWRWMWTILAVVLGIGEIFTAGFFLLPFAIGAVAAAILAWIGAAVLAQWLVFFGVSIFALAYLRKYIVRQDEGEQPRVGANRWVGEMGMVLEDIDPHTGAGMVRILNEEWRAKALAPIETGSRIVVTEVKGTRLVVERVES
jgi:membrane protein implicated in regulation of membrane protease activity